LTVDEKNPEQEIILESTLPVPCRSPFPQDCKIRVEMKATNDPKGKPNDITEKLLSKGFLAVKLKSSLPNFYVCHTYFFGGIRYGISMSQITTDIFCLLLSQSALHLWIISGSVPRVTSETGTAYPSGASELTPGFNTDRATIPEIHTSLYVAGIMPTKNHKNTVAKTNVIGRKS